MSPLPRSGRLWMQPFYDVLEGKGLRTLMFGSPTQALGFYGTTGLPRVPTMLLQATAGMTQGASGLLSMISNGGTGTFASFDAVVLALKNAGFLPK